MNRLPRRANSIFVALLWLISSALYSTATVPTINVQSYGALGNGAADDTLAINRAIAALPEHGGAILYFPCGVYLISSSLTPIRTSGTTVMGPTTNCVTLKATGANSMTMLEVSGPGKSAALPLTADTTSNTFTVASGGLATLGIQAGSHVLVSDRATQTNGPTSPLICDQQVVKVISVSGDTATIENTFSTPFTVAAGSYVENIIRPVIGDTIAYLTFDGSSNSGSNTMAVKLSYAVSSRIMFVTAKNFLGTGVSGGILMDTGYLNHLHDTTCYACGNGGGKSNDSVNLRRQTLAIVRNVHITNTASQQVFSFVINDTHYTTVSAVIVDAGGAVGRPFKLLRSSHNTFTDVTASNGAGGHNGFSITDVSTYNTFTNCVALRNSGKGIALFGNNNHHNTFNNCTAKYNQDAQFGQGPAYDGTYNDHYTTVNGGTFCCARGISAIIAIFSNHSSLTGASISDDLGQSAGGLTVSGSYTTIQNNQFSGFPSVHDIYVFSGLSTSTYSGNTVPDGTTPNGLP
jgi:pectate lyase-like protein